MTSLVSTKKTYLDPRQLPDGIVQVIGHINDKKCRELFGNWVERKPPEPGVLRGLKAGEPHHYLIQGPTFLIEYDNTQNDANHVHSVWHDPRNDFGADLLRAHYATGHAHA